MEHAGQDATEVFNAIDHSGDALEQMNKMVIGYLVPS